MTACYPTWARTYGPLGITATVASGPYSASDSARAASTVGALSTNSPSITLGRQSVGDDFHFRLAAHLGQLFQLPLVHHEIILAQDALDEHFQVGDARRTVAANSGLPIPSRHAGGQDDRAALLDDRQRSRSCP